jgi:RNA recognition motif-containing protein
LYVKNIPQNWTEENIKGLFSQFGEIENVKIGKLNVNSYAFVCFKEPD